MLWGSWIHHCTVISLLQRQSAGSNLKEWLCIHAYNRGKYLNKLEKHILGSLTLFNLQHQQPQCTQLRSQPSYIWLTMGSKVWVSFSQITFQPLCEKLQSIIALLDLSITYFIWCMMRYTMRWTHVPHKVTRCTKFRDTQRSSELALRSTGFRALENLIFPALDCTHM